MEDWEHKVGEWEESSRKRRKSQGKRKGKRWKGKTCHFEKFFSYNCSWTCCFGVGFTCFISWSHHFLCVLMLNGPTKNWAYSQKNEWWKIRVQTFLFTASHTKGLISISHSYVGALKLINTDRGSSNQKGWETHLETIHNLRHLLVKGQPEWELESCTPRMDTQVLEILPLPESVFLQK